MAYNWQCPFCGHAAALTGSSTCVRDGVLYTDDEGKDGSLAYTVAYLVCPNESCNEYVLHVRVTKRVAVKVGGGTSWEEGEEIVNCQLRPRGKAKPYAEVIPVQLRLDYREACLILEDSPKASATLARRCLQGILRDYFKVKPARLYDEIEQIKGKIPDELWKAIDAIREVGNIGAHSEKDIDRIIEVSKVAANALIDMIELLFEETYIRDLHRTARIKAAITAAGGIKDSSTQSTEEV